LMLECERVNRSRSDNAIGPAMKFSSRLATASGRQL
jgi:hypothetical protein